MKRAKSVDEYIKNAPEIAREKLEELRKTIKSAAPQAEEIISYGMPHYKYKGRIAYFAYSKDHIGLYAMPINMEKHQEEVAKYKTGKSTLNFPFNKPLPLALIKKLVKAQIEINEKNKPEFS